MASFVALEDPINAFLGEGEEKSDDDVSSNGGSDSDDSSNGESDSNDDNKEEESIVHHRSLFWRKSKEESFNDWTIVLMAHSDHEQIHQDNQESCADSIAKRQKTDKQTTFHVHRCILSQASLYFKSQFSAQIEAVEQRSSTSTIHLHELALQAFSVFLDYVYNPEQGRLGFNIENAVALRHLAMYFGVDMLLKDITDFILEGAKLKPWRKPLCRNAGVFHDDRLMEAIRTLTIRQESLQLVAPALFETLKADPAKYLLGDNETLRAWKHVMSNIDIAQDPFSALMNSSKYTNLMVSNAGLQEVNGLYKLQRVYKHDRFYTNGVCFLFKYKRCWELCIAYSSVENG